MHELWYLVESPFGTLETRDFKAAQDYKSMGYKVKVEYKYKNLDHIEPNENRKQKILTILGY